MSDGTPTADPAPSWESQFRAMERDWNEIAERRTRTLVADWRRAMSAMRSEHDRLVADCRWVTGPSDLLDVIGRAREENTHSRMLRWLLDPTGRHRLGCTLARRLVEHCTGRPAPAALAVRSVTFSQWRHGREADLVVCGDGFTLVIENKVDAPEQPDQCDDLYANYANFRDDMEPLFLFLTPDGRKPRTATAPGARRAFRTVSWPAVRTMIRAALDESSPAGGDPDAVAGVRNYLRTLEEQFG